MKIPDIYFDVFFQKPNHREVVLNVIVLASNGLGLEQQKKEKKSPEEGFFHVSFCCSFCTARCNYSRVKWTLMFSHSKFLFSSSPSRLQSTFCAFAADVIIAQKKQIVQNQARSITLLMSNYTTYIFLIRRLHSDFQTTWIHLSIFAP